MDIKVSNTDLPGLYQSADSSSLKEQKKYFNAIRAYLILIFVASLFSYLSTVSGTTSPVYKIISALLFFTTLAILVWHKINKPVDIWYNGRAVAESVKTRAWRWMMRAEPYGDCKKVEIMQAEFVKDLKSILEQNKSLFEKLGLEAIDKEPVSPVMLDIRNLLIDDRLSVYRDQRITNQALWYKNKAKYNKDKSTVYFVITVVLHAIAIILLLVNISDYKVNFPIETIAVAASGFITWAQSRKHNELFSSYSLTAREIILIKSETVRIDTEEELSEYIMNCENAFSREHTQWVARKSE